MTNKNVTFAEWEKAIREARTFVNNYEKVRWKVVTIALRVCDTSKGGRKTKDIFSIHKFAVAIDLNPKTLYQWIRIKVRVVDKLPAIELKDKSRYGYADLVDVSEKIKRDSTKAEVLIQWREQLRLPRENRRFLKYESHLNAILYNAQRPMNLIEVDAKIIGDMAQKSRLIANLLEKELEFREKFSKEKRMMNRESKIAKAVGAAQLIKLDGTE